MAIKVPSDEARTRRIEEIRSALQRRNFDQLRKALQLASSEYPNDVEVESFQHQLFQIGQAASVVSTLLKHARRKVDHGDYEAGIAKLRQALQIEPANREIPVALFDALGDFAKFTVDRDPDLARQLLREATELNPLSLRLEGIRNYIAERIRQRSVDGCFKSVQALRDRGLFREALEQVAALNMELHPFHIPALEEMRYELLDDLGIKPRETAAPPIDPTPVAAEPVEAEDSGSLVGSGIWRKTWQTWQDAAAAGRRTIRQQLREASRRLAVSLRHSETWAQDKGSHIRGLASRLPMVYPIATGVACLVLVFATAIIGRSPAPKPNLVRVGAGTLMLPVTLLRGPAGDSGVAGALKAGERVEILQQLPDRSLDAWARIRPIGSSAPSGYVRLQNLDQVQTEDRQFDLWVSLSFVDRATSPKEFKKRLEDFDQLLKENPPAPSRESDEIFLGASKAFARLASESAGNPKETETTRMALANSENYLMRIEGALRLSDDADALQYSNRQSRAAIEKPAPAPIRHAVRARPRVNEQTRIMSLAKNAYSQRIYERAANYCTQVLKINPKNKEARKLLDTVRRKQNDLVASIIRQ